MSPARIANVIARLETDVLAVQEILLPQAEEISKGIAAPFVFGASRLHEGKPYGNAVYTRLSGRLRAILRYHCPGARASPMPAGVVELTGRDQGELLCRTFRDIFHGAVETSAAASLASHSLLARWQYASDYRGGLQRMDEWRGHSIVERTCRAPTLRCISSAGGRIRACFHSCILIISITMIVSILRRCIWTEPS